MRQLSIRNLRRQAGRTQKELAELCDVDVATWRKWEKNPLDMPLGLYLQATEFLERAVQIRKEMKMSKDMGRVSVVFHDPDEDEPDTGYTVDVPEGAGEDFKPSQPVTMKGWQAWDTHGIEPYPGFADELMEWEKANERLNRAQLEADGAPVPELDTVHPDPEFDPQTGEAIEYADEFRLNVDAQTGEADMDVPESAIDPDELDDEDEGE